MKKESLDTVKGCTLNFLRVREHHAADVSWNPSMVSTTFLQNRLASSRSLYRRDLFAHYGCVNAIEFSQDGCFLISGGDDRRVLLWNLEASISSDYKPAPMKEEHSSNIFCLGFDSNNSKIFSAGNDEQVIVHDVETGETVNTFMHEEAIYGVSVNPCVDSLFASAGEDGQVLLFDTRASRTEEPLLLARSYDPFHAVQFHPVEPRFIVTANPKEGVVLWDVRKPRVPFMKFGDKKAPESSMCARFNSNGTQVVALRRRLPPILYNTHTSSLVCQFDADHYYNSCTMKSCSFAGSRDQYVLSGSDDFNLYIWKIPDADSGVRFVSNAHLVLKGHRSIVNQVRFNSRNFIIASSGVEKIVKLWSPLSIPGSYGNIDSEQNTAVMTRRVYTHEEYIGLVLDSGQNVSHDYSHGSTAEDPRMMAFFDSLVQREVEGWTTNTDFSDDSASTPYSSSTIPTTQSDDSDNDNSPGYIPRPNSSGPSGSVASRIRRRRVAAVQGCRRDTQEGEPTHPPSSDRGEQSDQNKPPQGSDWILRLIAKKRAQLKAAKRKRKHAKKKQKHKSRKYLRYLTSRRPRQYLNCFDNRRAASAVGTTSTSSAELIRRRHVVAPYTIMSLNSYADSEEEETDEESEDERHQKVDECKNVKKNETATNTSGEGLSSPSLNSTMGLSCLKKSSRLWSSDSSSSNEEFKEAAPVRRHKRKVSKSSSDSNAGPVKKISRICELVSDILVSDSSNDDANIGANRIRKLVENKDTLKRSDIELSDNSNATCVASYNTCSTSIDVRQNQSSLSDVIPISGVAVDESGSVSFDLNQNQHSVSSLDLFSSVQISEQNSRSGGLIDTPENPRSSHIVNHSSSSLYSNGLKDDEVVQIHGNINGVQVCSTNVEEGTSVSHFSNTISTSTIPPIHYSNNYLVSNSNSSPVHSDICYADNLERRESTVANGLDCKYPATPDTKSRDLNSESCRSGRSIENRSKKISVSTPESDTSCSHTHTPESSNNRLCAYTSDSGISSINNSNHPAVLSSGTEQENSSSPGKMQKSGDIIFKKRIPEYRYRKYRSRHSDEDI